jgi:hypothetical protein
MVTGRANGFFLTQQLSSTNTHSLCVLTVTLDVARCAGGCNTQELHLRGLPRLCSVQRGRLCVRGVETCLSAPQAGKGCNPFVATTDMCVMFPHTSTVRNERLTHSEP